MGDTQSFYDILQIPNDASPEQIRRAYKKQALMTHPDRLPAGYTPTDKINAEERFRKVSNAYEVLKDPENRRLYDAHGVWPPPTQLPEQPHSSRRESHRSGWPNRYEPFPDPFANFSEPFELFDKIFSEYRRPSYHSMHRSASNWHRGPFEAMYRMQDMMSDLERELFSFPTRPLAFGFDPLPFGNSGQAQWASQSTIVSSVNGVTRRIEKRRDWEGNEHVTHTYPDGREVYKINGVEQQRPAQGYLPPPGSPPYSSRNALPSSSQMNNARAFISPPPSYHSTRSSGHNSNASHGYRRGRHSSGPVIPGDAGPVIPDVNAEKRRWWRGGR